MPASPFSTASDRLVARLRTHHPHDFGISSVVRAELTYGARRSRHVARNLDAVETFCDPFRSVAFDDDCAGEYGAIRAELEALGQPIGPKDLMIAATARAHSVTVVTANLREFGRVVALRVEDWEGPKRVSDAVFLDDPREPRGESTRGGDGDMSR
jgi:tRNA(fMet)-specific endonuclease VapC